MPEHQHINPVRAFPAGLKMIARNGHAFAPQDPHVTYWNCGAAADVPSSADVPTCPDTRGMGLRLHVNFPSCWDGRRLDSIDHQRHMAYAVWGLCPATHPVAVPRSRSSTGIRSRAALARHGHRAAATRRTRTSSTPGASRRSVRSSATA
jgi:hypothetical protein